MKKTKLLLLAALLVSGSLVSCGSKSETISFGLGYQTSFANSHGTWELDVTVCAAAFDKDGKVLDARVDVTQCKFAIAEATEGYTVSLKAGSGESSKLELGTDYGMAGVSDLKLEVYKQWENCADWTVGKTAAEVVANEETITGCSISTGAFNTALSAAYAKRYDVKVSSTKGLKVGVGMVHGGLWEGELSTYIAGALTDGSKVLASYVDCVTSLPSATDASTVTLQTQSYGSVNKYAANADEGQALKSKRDLGDKYGMGGVSPIKAEYNVQCASLDAYVTGKTLAEVAAIASDATITGVTVTANGLIDASKEAVAYSVKDVITSKPQA